MAIYELLADLGILFGIDIFVKKLQAIFLGYLTNTAASCRAMGVEKSALLAKRFGESWIVNSYIPIVQNTYGSEEKGYNYRMSCLYSLASIMPFVKSEVITQEIVPVFKKAFDDAVPNVQFCVCKIVHGQRKYIDEAEFSRQFSALL